VAPENIEHLLKGYAAGKVNRVRLLDALETDDFSVILAALKAHGLLLPRAPTAGRERDIAALRDLIGRRTAA